MQDFLTLLGALVCFFAVLWVVCDVIPSMAHDVRAWWQKRKWEKDR